MEENPVRDFIIGVLAMYPSDVTRFTEWLAREIKSKESAVLMKSASVNGGKQ